jgi:hypothetical protein
MGEGWTINFKWLQGEVSASNWLAEPFESALTVQETSF